MVHELHRLRCDDKRCGWVSDELTSAQLSDRGVPWYCDDCGRRVSNFIHFNQHERGEVAYLWNLNA